MLLSFVLRPNLAKFMFCMVYKKEKKEFQLVKSKVGSLRARKLISTRGQGVAPQWPCGMHSTIFGGVLIRIQKVAQYGVQAQRGFEPETTENPCNLAFMFLLSSSVDVGFIEPYYVNLCVDLLIYSSIFILSMMCGFVVICEKLLVTAIRLIQT